MADINKQTPLLLESVVEPDFKAQFVNGGEEPHVAIECGWDDDVSFTGLGKEKLMQYADNPFWKKRRLILLIICCVGLVIAMLVAAVAIIIIVQVLKSSYPPDQKCPYPPDQKWYDKDTMYEILSQSFQDSNPKAGKHATQTPGEGVGDIKGIYLFTGI